MDNLNSYEEYRKKVEEKLESKAWEKAQRINTKESYKHYLNEYGDSFDKDFNWEALYKLGDIYKELLTKKAQGFDRFQENILWKLNTRSYNYMQEAFLECDNGFKIIEHFSSMLNSKELNRFPKIKEDWIHTASIIRDFEDLEKEYQEFKLQYNNKIKKLSDLIDNLEKLSYSSNFKEKYITKLLLAIEERYSIHISDIEESELLVSLSFKNCNEQNIPLSKVEKNIREIFTSCFTCDNRMYKVGKLLYFTTQSVVALTQKYRSNPLLSLITPFYSIEIYIGEKGIIFYNEKLDYYNRECLLYDEFDMSKEINEHKYLKDLEQECKDKILELSKNK